MSNPVEYDFSVDNRIGMHTLTPYIDPQRGNNRRKVRAFSVVPAPNWKEPFVSSLRLYVEIEEIALTNLCWGRTGYQTFEDILYEVVVTGELINDLHMPSFCSVLRLRSTHKFPQFHSAGEAEQEGVRYIHALSASLHKKPPRVGVKA